MGAPPEQRQNPDILAAVERFFDDLHLEKPLESATRKKDWFSDLLHSVLKVDRVEPGRVSCSLTVDATLANWYNTLHGGAVAFVAQMISLACAKTAAGDKDFFLGESNTSYLSAAKLNIAINHVYIPGGTRLQMIPSGFNCVLLREIEGTYAKDIVQIDASIVRQGRSVVVTSIDFRNIKTGKLLYTSRSTFYIMPVASL